MKRNVISHSEAQSILYPYYERISNAVADGFDDYLKIAKSSSDIVGYINYESRTKACIIHDHIKSRINSEFSSVQEVETGVWNGIFGLKINNDLFIRFNKINDDYSAKGKPTKQAKAYKNQMMIDGFPDEPTFLYAGYRPDGSWTQIKGIYITCFDGEVRKWVEEIISHRTIVQATIPFSSPKPENQKRVRIKKDKNNKMPDSKTGTND